MTNVLSFSSALKCAKSELAEGQSFGSAALKLETNVEHESVNQSTGIFDVKPAVNGFVPQPRSAGNSKF